MKPLDFIYQSCARFCGVVTAIFGLLLLDGVIVIETFNWWFAYTFLVIGLITIFLPYIKLLLIALWGLVQRKRNSKSLRSRILEVESAN